MRILLKSQRFCLLWQRHVQLCGKDYRNINGVSVVLHNAFSTYAELGEANDLPTIDESPELPDWVKSSDTNKGSDDDFVPPSVSYWIEKHQTRVQNVDMKSIVNDIVESDVDKISKILKNQFKSPDLVMKALDGCCVVDLSDSLVEQVLWRFSCEWIPAFGFFKWAELQKGVPHSPVLHNLMIDNLGKMKKFDIMWELVDEVKRLEGYITLVTITKIIRRLARAGKYDEAIEVFETMGRFGVDKDIAAMNILMDALVKEGSVEHAEQAFLNLKEHIPPNSQTYNVLIHGWCKIRKIDKAKKTLDEMKRRGLNPDSVTYTSFIAAYSREKDFHKVDATLQEMKKNGVRPCVVSYTIMMDALAKAKQMNKAMEVYEQMKQNNCSPDVSFYNVLINALSKSGRLKDSNTVFEDMSKQGVTPGVVTYNTLILIATERLEEEKALSLLIRMEESGCKPDLNTYVPLLKMCCLLKRMKVLSFLLTHMFKNDVSPDLSIYSLLVTRLCKNGRIDRACSFFEEMVLKGLVPNDCTYELLINGLEKKGMHEKKQGIEEVMTRARQSGSSNKNR